MQSWGFHSNNSVCAIVDVITTKCIDPSASVIIYRERVELVCLFPEIKFSVMPDNRERELSEMERAVLEIKEFPNNMIACNRIEIFRPRYHWVLKMDSATSSFLFSSMKKGLSSVLNQSDNFNLCEIHCALTVMAT